MKPSIVDDMEGKANSSFISCTKEQNEICQQTLSYPLFLEPPWKKYARPRISMVGLMILSLWNTENKILSCDDLKHIISKLFPYFKNQWTVRRHKYLLEQCGSGKYSSYFLKYQLTQQHLLIMLNPAEEKSWKHHLQSCINGHESDIKSSMGQPGLLEALQHGHARLDKWIQQEAACGPSSAMSKCTDGERNVKKGDAVEMPVVSQPNNQVLFVPQRQSKTEPCEKEQGLNVAHTEKVQVNSNEVVIISSDSDVSDCEVEIVQSFSNNQSLVDKGHIGLVYESVVKSNSGMEKSYDMIDVDNSNVPMEAQKCKVGAMNSEMATNEVILLGIENPSYQSVEYPDTISKDELETFKHTESQLESKWRKVSFEDEATVTGMFATAGLRCGGTQRINDFKVPDTNMQEMSEVKGNDNPTSAGEKDSSVVSNVSEIPTYDSNITGIPDIESCVKSWKKIFPWMHFIKKRRTFVCTYCYCGHGFMKNIPYIAFSPKKPTDVYIVAKHLKNHSDSEKHKEISERCKLLREMFSVVYSLLRKFKYHSLQDIEDQLLLDGNENFAKLGSHKRREYIGFWIKCISVAVERRLVRSLRMSPAFSIMDLEDMNFSILRWITSQGYIEEHLFPLCGDLLLPYLQKNNVDVTRVVSRASFPVPNSLCSSIEYKEQIPIRSTPVHILIQWLGKTRLLNPLFLDLEKLVGLCKTYPYRFSQFPIMAEIIMFKESYSQYCIVSENIMKYYIKKHAEFDFVLEEINAETGKSDTFNFCFCSNVLSEAVQLLISNIATLWKQLTLKPGEEMDPCSLRKIQEDLLSHSSRWNDYSIVLEALNLIVIFVTHVITTKESPNRKSFGMFQMKVNDVTVQNIEDCLIRLKIQYKGGSYQCLQDIQEFQRMVGLKEDTCVNMVMSVLQKRFDLLQRFNELCSFFHKMHTVPASIAHRHTFRFNLVAFKLLLGDKMNQEYISSLSMICLEDLCRSSKFMEYP